MGRKFKANYHTHTYLCNHASGEIKDYVESAISAGLEVLGFSCHAPYVFPEGYYSGFRMKPEQQKTYVDSILALREEYKGKIDILLGYETEYYPKHFADTLELLNRYPCDYIIMGQHAINNEYDTYPSDDLTCSEELDCYVNQLCEGMRLGVYTYVAHPDMMTYAFPDSPDFEERLAYYRKKMSEVCRVSLDTDTPLEINMLGIRDNRVYPKESFMSLIGEFGCKAIAGADAHSPDVVARKEDYRRVLEYADKYGINLIDYVPLRTPKLKAIPEGSRQEP